MSAHAALPVTLPTAFAIIIWHQLIHLCTLLLQLSMQLTRNAHEWISWGKMLTAANAHRATCTPARPGWQLSFLHFPPGFSFPPFFLFCIQSVAAIDCCCCCCCMARSNHVCQGVYVRALALLRLQHTPPDICVRSQWHGRVWVADVSGSAMY